MQTPIFCLTNEHTDIYDRQIRVWGMETQKKLANSVLKLVNVDSVNFEVGKNCILSGINLEVDDSGLIEEKDVLTNLFVKLTDVGNEKGIFFQGIFNKINCLPRVGLGNGESIFDFMCCSESITNAFSIVTGVPSFFVFKSKKFVLVLSNFYGKNEGFVNCLDRIIDKIPSFLVKFKNKPSINFYCFLAALYMEKFNLSEPPACFINLDAYLSGIRKVKKNFGKDFYPCASVVGGVISQEIINSITENRIIQMFFFDGKLSSGYIEVF